MTEPTPSGRALPPNDGVRPTADTPDFVVSESPGAAGDAGR
jgi:hypothetical protein